MKRPINRVAGVRTSAAWILIFAALMSSCAQTLLAAGSGLNVLLVVNEASSNSCEIANYYRVKRNVPPENVLKVSWTGSDIQWTDQEFTNTLLNPLLGFVAQESLAQQIQYVVLSMDIPYRITGGQENSTTAALFYGFKPSPAGSDMENTYALSETRFAESKPDTAPTNSFLTMMLTAESVEVARQIIDHGVDSDRTYPTQKVWLAKSTDPDRNIRHTRFDNAIFDSRLFDGYCLGRTNLYSDISSTNLLGCQLGLATFSMAPSTFIPGAIADNLTSFGGKIFENPGQTTLLELIEAGASASYGTVTEPVAGHNAKFPDPMVYFYQSRGFSLAECYYQSVQQPFQGLFVGEPLAAPWGRYFNGGWTGIMTNSVLGGTTNLCVSFTPDSAARPLQRIDLFLNGRHLNTLTNITPQSGNLLTVRLNGYPVSYEVPTNASLETIAAELATELNEAEHTNITQVAAHAVGDRIELQSLAAPLPDGVFEVIDNDATFDAPRVYLAAPPAQTIASSVTGGEWTEEDGFHIQFSTTPGVSNLLQASTNLSDWVTLLTNATGGTVDYIDADAASHSQRYYRIAMPHIKPVPHLTALGVNASNRFVVRVNSPTNRPYVLQSSSDFMLWSDRATNNVSGTQDHLDDSYSGQLARYYRTRSADSNDYSPISVVGQTPSGGNILHIQEGQLGDTILWSSTNSADWLPIYTHAGMSQVQTEVDSRSGDGEALTTHLRSAQPEFLDSIAHGIRKFIVTDKFPANGTIDVGEYLSLRVTKTNGALLEISLTNSITNALVEDFVSDFVAAVNSDPELMQSDGLVIEDLAAGVFPWSREFVMRALSPGLQAAQIQVSLQSSSGLLILSSGTFQLDENQSDLLPRNHLYVGTGTPSMTHYFDIDTTSLPDGHHELTAVAYEGTSVYSQTHSTVPVVIQNTPLEASIALAASGLVMPVTNSFDVVVIANTNLVDEIQLFTTAGLYAGTSNQAAASFEVTGTDLGVGEHPFYALVTTTNNWTYRTRTLQVTLTK